MMLFIYENDKNSLVNPAEVKKAPFGAMCGDYYCCFKRLDARTP